VKANLGVAVVRRHRAVVRDERTKILAHIYLEPELGADAAIRRWR